MDTLWKWLILLRRRFTYTLYGTFSEAQAAPLTSPLQLEEGSLTIVDTGNKVSISGGKLNVGTQTTGGTPAPDPRLYRQTSRSVGRCLKIEVTPVAERFIIAFAGDTNFNLSTLPIGVQSFSGAVWVFDTGSTLSVQTVPITTSTSYIFALVLQSTGGFVFIRGGAFANWVLIWIVATDTTSILYAGYSCFGTSAYSSEFIRETLLPTPFNSNFGIAAQNIASPAHLTSYSAGADLIIDLTITAPGVLANECGFRYRIQDADNYWRAYFNSAGAFRLDSVSGGVATNRISVAGVISGGGTRTIRIICEGSLHDAYTLSGTAWAKRGSQINVSHLNTLTDAAADIGSGWTVANLQAFPRTSSQYRVLDEV